MNPKKILKALYRQIPIFDCKSGCTDCCGPIIVSKWEIEKISRPFQPFTNQNFKNQKLCQFAVKGRCEIYVNRPLICRLHGTVEDFKCPYGCGPKKLLSEKQGHEIIKEYVKMIQKGG